MVHAVDREGRGIEEGVADLGPSFGVFGVGEDRLAGAVYGTTLPDV